MEVVKVLLVPMVVGIMVVLVVPELQIIIALVLQEQLLEFTYSQEVAVVAHIHQAVVVQPLMVGALVLLV